MGLVEGGREGDTGAYGGRGEHHYPFRESENTMKSKKIAGVLLSMTLAGGLALVGSPVANAAVYSCGPRCYTDDPNWRPGEMRTQY